MDLISFCIFDYSFYGRFLIRLCVEWNIWRLCDILFSSVQLGPWRVDPVHRNVWRWNSDTRSDLQARNIRHVDDEGQRGRLSRGRPFGPQGPQLQLGTLCQMAHLRLGKSENLFRFHLHFSHFRVIYQRD